ncbi:transposase [Candidatus Bathyarchaeota archaeon]|nr:transposase [Candidatus Bathyarchaeota archaeon]
MNETYRTFFSMVKEVKSAYTSQTCPRCGHIGKENWKGYSYFQCVKCGYEADRDRTASRNIAERADKLFSYSQVSILSDMPQSTGTS